MSYMGRLVVSALEAALVLVVDLVRSKGCQTVADFISLTVGKVLRPSFMESIRFSLIAPRRY
jgi:hypothetical protein